jgi:hypothetical protein
MLALIFSSSSLLCTSSKTSKPKLWQTQIVILFLHVKTAAISKIKSAPYALASRMVFIYKTFRKAECLPRLLPKVNHQNLQNIFHLFKTEIPQAPAFSYPFTTSSTVKIWL